MNKKFVLFCVALVSLSIALIGISWWNQNKFSLPKIISKTPFFVSTESPTNGQIIAQIDNQKTSISPTGYTVDQFVLWKKKQQQKIFFIAKKNNTESNHKTLFERDLVSGKIRKILDEPEFLLQKIWLHPQKKWLILEKNNRENYDRVITMLDIEKKTQQPIPIPTPWVNFSFSPDGQSIIGLDTSKDVGFEIQNFWKKNQQEIILGNYLQNFGFAPDGKKILLAETKNDDIFASQTDLILYQTNGEKNNIFSAARVIDTKWINASNLLVASHNQDFEYELHKISIVAENKTQLIHSFGKQKIITINPFEANKIFVSTQSNSSEDFSDQPMFEIYQITNNSIIKKIAPNAFDWQIFN